MDATLNVSTKTSASAVLSAEEKAELRPVQAKSGKLLVGEGLNILNDRSFLEGFNAREVSVQMLVSTLIDQKFAAMKQVAKNMGVTEEQRKEAERRMEELEELRRKLQDQEIDFEKAIARFKQIGISEGDRAQLEMALAVEKPTFA